VGRYISLPLLLLAIILQTTIVPAFRIAGGGVDLVFLLVISWTMLAGLEEGVIWAIIGGVLQDLSAGTPLGASSLALVCTCTLVNVAVGQVARRNIVVPPLVAAGGTVVYHVLIFAIFAFAGQSVDFGFTLVYVTLPTLAFNAILILIVFRLLGRAYASSRPRGVSM
jgi:rod shape-determining protein MreD